MPFSVCTWNTASLFGAFSSAAARVAMKRQLHCRLLRDNLVVYAQETRGAAGDLASLPLSHRHFGSFRDVDGDFCTSRAGGVVTSIHDSIINRTTYIYEQIIAAGRCLALFLSGPLFAFIFINIHMNPQWNLRQKKHVLASAAKFIAKFPAAILFMGGDWNFIHGDDRRMNLQSGIEAEGNDPISHAFEEAFPHLTELSQPNFTRSSNIHAIASPTNTLSRIDRLYTNLPAADLFDIVVLVDTVGSILDAHRPSDHLPVVARLAAPSRRSGPARIPQHIVTHPLFASHLSELYTDDLYSLPVDQALIVSKQLLREAASRTRSEIALGGLSCTKVQLSGVIGLVRAIRVRDKKAISKSLELAPFMLAHFDVASGAVSDPKAISSALHRLMQAAIDEDLAALEQSALSADRKKPKRELLRQRQCLWRSSRRKTNSMALRGPDGHMITSTQDISDHLISHWSPVFAAKGIDLEAAAHFLQHVQPVPADFCWDISRDSFSEVISSTGASAPGPDGIPYGAWRFATPPCHDVLFRLLDEMLCTDGALPDGFNASQMVFIPKGDEIGDDLVVGRSAGDLRPLNLSNTDNKLVSLALNSRLSHLCKLTVAEQQRGFVSGRHIEDNIFTLESAALAFSATNVKRAAVILFDFMTAFPSIAHAWIFMVLTTMGIPARFIAAIQKLYLDCFAALSFNGMELDALCIASGIKQGCPLSGSIFALAIDPLVRFLLTSSVLGSMQITAYADDIAIVIANLFTQLPRILQAFRSWALASCLVLNSKKSAVLPLWCFDEALIRRWLRYVAPRFATCLIQPYAKYLGIVFGPGASDVQWATVEHKVLARSAEASFAARGLNERLRHFRMHGTSTVMYKAQFVLLAPSLLQAYRKAEQRLTAAPWMALPPDLLHGLRSVGLPVDLPDLSLLATAAKLRVVATSATFWSGIAAFEVASSSDEVILHPPLTAWYGESIMFTLKKTWDIHHQMDPVKTILLSGDRGAFQRKFYKYLAGQSISEAALLIITRRVRYWHVDDEACRVDAAVICTVLRSRLPAGLKLSVLRTVCNAWNTTSRFHQPVAACQFGCPAPADDRLAHYLCCPALARPADRLLSLDVNSLSPSPLLRLFLMLATQGTRVRAAVFIDAALFAFNGVKNGASGSPACLFAGRVKDMHRLAPARGLRF
jgi:hypothetical protein